MIILYWRTTSEHQHSDECLLNFTGGNMRNVMATVALLIFGLFMFSGCAALTGKTAGETVDDATITTQANAAIVKDADARLLKIDVDTRQGNVVLNGFVNSKETEQRIVNRIQDIKGVKSVKSLLKVEQPR
jgi:hyperosmotically inducible periplasmic protein